MAETPRSLTHELNNVLTKILGEAELAMTLTQDAVARSRLDRIARFAEDAGALVQQVALSQGAPSGRRRRG